MNRIFLLTMVIFIACRGKHNHEHSKNENDMQEHKHSQANHENHEHGRANKHMHQSSLDDLVKRFESPERDEYQQPDKVLAYLGDIKDKTIMDIGAGTGYFSVKLADHGAHVIAADVDDDFQDYLKNELKTIISPALKQGKYPMIRQVFQIKKWIWYSWLILIITLKIVLNILIRLDKESKMMVPWSS